MNEDHDPLDMLKRELASVSVPANFAARVQSRIAERPEAELDALHEELAAVSVSPEFAVRVRQQIEAAPSPSRWFGVFDWRWAVPVAAAAAIAAFALTRGTEPATGVDPAGVQTRGPEHDAPRVPQAPQGPPVTSIAPGLPVPPVSQPSHAGTPRVNERTATSPAASGEQADDRLEVITDQPAILRQLWAAVTRVEVAEAPVGLRELVIVPVEVTPVAVQWLVEPLPSGGVTPIIRRVSADAERSNK